MAVETLTPENVKFWKISSSKLSIPVSYTQKTWISNNFVKPGVSFDTIALSNLNIVTLSHTFMVIRFPYLFEHSKTAIFRSLYAK